MSQENAPHDKLPQEQIMQDDAVIADMEHQFQEPDTSKLITDKDKAEVVAHAAYEPELEVLAARKIVDEKTAKLGKKDTFFGKPRTQQLSDAEYKLSQARSHADRVADQAAQAYDKNSSI
jgi:hypothetical protein